MTVKRADGFSSPSAGLVGRAPAVTVWDLVKTYPGPDGASIKAVDGISFELVQSLGPRDNEHATTSVASQPLCPGGFKVGPL